jgi:hypothetical protein
MFMIAWFFMFLASKKSMVCVLTKLMMFLFLMYTTQESKKCNKFENIANASSNSVIIELMKI